jgi:chromosomal replication initiator protein
LISRLSQGIIVPLEYPAGTTREHLLRVFADRTGLSLNNEAILELAKQNNTAPELLNQLLTLRSGRESLDQLSIESEKTRTTQAIVDPKKLIRVTAKYYGLKPQDLSGPSRRKQHVLARSMAMFLLRQITTLSFQDIGLLFGKRDHTTVMHAYRKIQTLVELESTTEDAKSEILQRLYSLC